MTSLITKIVSATYKGRLTSSSCGYVWHIQKVGAKKAGMLVIFMQKWGHIPRLRLSDCRADKDSYPHDCRADNASNRHDRRADKNPYRHDRNMRFS